MHDRAQFPFLEYLPDCKKNRDQAQDGERIEYRETFGLPAPRSMIPALLQPHRLAGQQAHPPFQGKDQKRQRREHNRGDAENHGFSVYSPQNWHLNTPLWLGKYRVCAGCWLFIIQSPSGSRLNVSGFCRRALLSDTCGAQVSV